MCTWSWIWVIWRNKITGYHTNNTHDPQRFLYSSNFMKRPKLTMCLSFMLLSYHVCGSNSHKIQVLTKDNSFLIDIMVCFFASLTLASSATAVYVVNYFWLCSFSVLFVAAGQSMFVWVLINNRICIHTEEYKMLYVALVCLQFTKTR